MLIEAAKAIDMGPAERHHDPDVHGNLSRSGGRRPRLDAKRHVQGYSRTWDAPVVPPRAFNSPSEKPFLCSKDESRGRFLRCSANRAAFSRPTALSAVDQLSYAAAVCPD